MDSQTGSEPAASFVLLDIHTSASSSLPCISPPQHWYECVLCAPLSMVVFIRTRILFKEGHTPPQVGAMGRHGKMKPDRHVCVKCVCMRAHECACMRACFCACVRALPLYVAMCWVCNLAS